MASERCFVGVVLNGINNYYQRESERRSKAGNWEAVPFVVPNRSEAITMSEGTAMILVARLRSFGVVNPWIEDNLILS